jgi:hypothetical protein
MLGWIDLAGARFGQRRPPHQVWSAPRAAILATASGRPAEHMHTSIFASVHVTPIATNHALTLAMTWPSGIPLRVRVPRTWRSNSAKGVGCGSSGHIVNRRLRPAHAQAGAGYQWSIGSSNPALAQDRPQLRSGRVLGLRTLKDRGTQCT